MRSVSALRRMAPPGMAVALALFAGTAEACDCGHLDEPRLFDNVEAVLLVWVTRTEAVPGTRHVRAAFEVVETFKGRPSLIKTFRTRTPLQAGDCVEPIVTGERYLVYVPQSGIPTFGMCSASRRFDETREETWLTRHRKGK